MRAARASLLLVTLASASAWRVGFDVELRAEVRLSSIHNFGADGGSVHASFTLRRPPCSPALAGAECWAPTERLYMVVVDAAQWEGMRDTFRGDTDLDCQQPSAARAELSFLRWREAELMRARADPSAHAAADAAHELRFEFDARLPSARGLHSLALFNCAAASGVIVAGEATFHGRAGEPLSIPQQTLRAMRAALCAANAA